MDACKLGIAVFDQLQTGGFNPNISLEIGYMLAGGSVPLLLKERCLPSLPSDIVGKLYREFDIKNLEVTIKKAMRGWLRDIGIAKTPTERVVVFVSTGGRDRCAMAKVIAQELFKKNVPPFPLRFESMAAFHGNGVMASDQSRRVIEESYKKDLLASHRVMRRCDGIIQDADLILVMEKEFLGFFPCEKTHLITEFFGRSGDITNPKPGNLSDYNKCLQRLRPLIETNYRKILRALENKDREAVDDEQSHH
jgi:protein-tyrosine-phosphatase